MKKKSVIFLTCLLSAIFLSSACSKPPALAGSEVKLASNAYIAESSSGDIVINFDNDGMPVEIIDANGDVIDLKSSDVTVKTDKKTGKILSVQVGAETHTVKEKATEENAEKIIAKAKDVQEKKIAEAKKSSEKKVAIADDKVIPCEPEEDLPGPSLEELEISSDVEEKPTVPGVDFKVPDSIKETEPEQKTSKKQETKKEAEPESETGVSEEVQKIIDERVAANTPSFNETPASGTYYPVITSGGSSIPVYQYPSTDYGRKPDNGTDASIPTSYLALNFPVMLLGRTDNGWLHVSYTSTNTMYAYEVGTPHTIDGYIQDGYLISESDNQSRIEAENRKNLENQKRMQEQELEEKASEEAEKKKENEENKSEEQNIKENKSQNQGKEKEE